MDNKELLTGVLAGNAEAIKVATERISGPATSAGLWHVPKNGTLPDNTTVYLEGGKATLKELRSRNRGKGRWALFHGCQRGKAYAAFNGSEIRPDDTGVGIPLPEWLNQGDPVTMGIFIGSTSPDEIPEGWTVPGLEWANR